MFSLKKKKKATLKSTSMSFAVCVIAYESAAADSCAAQVAEEDAGAGESAVDAVKRMNDELAKAATSDRAVRKVASWAKLPGS